MVTCESPPLRSVEERNALVLKWRPLVSHVYRCLRKNCLLVRRLGYEDALSAGTLGLINAAALWDESRGVSFKTYAFYAIRRDMMKAGELTFQIYVPGYVFTSPAADEALKRQGARCHRRAVNVRRSEHEDGSLVDLVVPCSQHAQDAHMDRRELVKKLMAVLPKKHRVVIRMMFYRGLTPLQIGRKFGCSRQRIDQIYRQAINQMKGRN
jgi:RNA polymerase sigma factor (sigma-70 family)